MKWSTGKYKKTYYIFLFSILFTLIIREVIVQYSIDQQKTDAKIINLTGRQRMLSQRVSKVVLFLSIKDKQKLPFNNYNLNTLQKLTKEWENTYQHIYNYSKFHTDDKILALYKTNSVYHQKIINSCNLYLSNPSQKNITNLIDVISKNELKFLLTMEDIVFTYQRNAEKKIERLRIIEFSLFGFTVLLFLVQLLFVIYPLLSQILKNNSSLKKLNNDLSTSENEFKNANQKLIKVSEDLEAQEKQNRIFIEQAPSASAMLDNDLKYLAASDKWMQDYQLIGKEIIGRSHYEIFPEIGDDWKKIHQECLKGAVNICKEAEFPRANGTSQWLAWDVRPWYKSNKDIGGLLFYTEDITVIKQKDAEKSRIEAILNKTSEVARIGTWEFDLITNKIYWSKVTKEIHEVDQDYIPELESAINFFVEGESRNKIQLAVSEAIENGIPYDVEIQLKTYKGNLVWTRAIGQVKFLNGKCVSLYGVFQDINKIKTTENALSLVNSELKAIFDSSPVAIISTTKDGLITHFNKGAENMLLYSSDEVLGKQKPDMFHKPEEIIKLSEELSSLYNKEIKVEVAFIELMADGKMDTRQWTYIRKNGENIPVELTIAPIRNEVNDIAGFLGIATDISERLKSENIILESNENLKLLTDRLTVQNTQLASFAHITSHNLRAPVGNLNALLSFYKMEESIEDKEMLMGKFEIVINHLTSTLNTLVDSLKIKETKDASLEKLSFQTIYEKTIETLIGQIMQTNAEITSDFTKAPEIIYNQTYLESILLNLITNALKYKDDTRKPEIVIETLLIDKRLVLKVTDNGLGIDLKKHGDKLFGLNKTFHRHEEAKGVGLYLTKTQIEAMGGKIYAQSEVNKGTTFIIEF